MSVMKYFIKNSAIRMFTFGLGVIASFIVTPHVLRCLGKTGYGSWSLLACLYAYFIILDLGIYQAVMQKFAAAKVNDDKEQIQSIFSSGLCVLFCTFLFTLATGWVMAFFRDSLFPSEFTRELGLCSILVTTSFACILLCRASFGLLAGSMHWTLLALFSSLRLIISSVGVLIFMDASFPHAENLVRMGWVSFTAFLVEQACIAIAARRLVKVPFSLKAVSLARVKELLRFGLPLQVVSVGIVLKNNTQIYLVASLISVAQVTILALANQLLRYMNDVLLTVFGILSPYFSTLKARGDDEECRQSLIGALKLSYSTSCIIGFGLAFYGTAFLTWWLGPGYEEVQQVIVPLALAAILNCGEEPIKGCLVGLGKHGILAYYFTGQGLCVVLLSIPAVWIWGFAGIGWVVFICTVAVNFCMLPRYTSRVVNLPLTRYYRELLGVLIPQALAHYAFYSCVKEYVRPDLLIIAAVVAGQCLVGAAVFIVSHFLTKKRGPATAAPLQ